MKWLNDYVKADMPIKEFAAEMTMSGSKVETYEDMRGPLEKVVIGKVVEMKKHEDSEKLWICQVDVGQGAPIQIVTAAQNVFEGACIPVVLDGGTVIDRKNHTTVKIKKGKLRGARRAAECSAHLRNLEWKTAIFRILRLTEFLSSTTTPNLIK